MVTISISELRSRVDEYIRRIKLGEAIIITKYGKPVAEFIPAKMIQDNNTIANFANCFSDRHIWVNF